MNVWTAIDRIVDSAADPTGVRAHGLQLWAARRWRATGRTVPEEFLADERAAAFVTRSARPQLSWIRGILDGPIVLLKGPEVAARYPDPALRPFGDLDLFVPDAGRAQRALLAAGAKEVGPDLPGHHHRPALECPGAVLLVEIHETPGWPRWATAPTDDLFTAAVPSALGVDGLLTVPPIQHAVLLAAHGWREEPLHRVIDLADVAAMADRTDPAVLLGQAERWGLGRVWETTSAAVTALVTGEPPADWPDRLLARHLWTMRERSVGEQRLARWSAGGWAPTPIKVVHAVTAAVAKDVRPQEGQSWGAKGLRIAAATRAARRPISAYRRRHGL